MRVLAALLMVCISLASWRSAAQAQDIVLVRLANGATLTAPMLRRNDEGIVLDLGSQVIAFPTRQVVEVRPITDEETQSSSKQSKQDVYTVGRLEHSTVARLVGSYGDAVVTVNSPAGTGSGFLISDEGHLITNYHVIEETLEITVSVFQNTGSGYERRPIKKVKILALNPHRDLALLQIDAQEMQKLNVPHVVIAEKEVTAGDMVFTIGNPLGLERSVTMGIVSSVTRTLDHLRFLQTDTAVNPGNSGGPLFNLRGEVVGVACAGYATFDGLAFGIPGADLIDFLQHRDAYLFDATQPQNGIKYLAPPFQAKNQQPALETTDVESQ